MAQYTVTGSCGHTHTVNLIGKTAERQRKIGWLETQLCPECHRQERTAADKAAAEQAGMPALSDGSEKQIAWGESIRRDYIRKISESIAAFERGEKARQLDTIAALLHTDDGTALITGDNLFRFSVALDAMEELGIPQLTANCEIMRAWIKIARACASAKWWIDHRDAPLTSLPALAAQIA